MKALVLLICPILYSLCGLVLHVRLKETKIQYGDDCLFAFRAGNKSTAVVEKLLSAGVDVAVLDKNGTNALLLAARLENVQLVRMVLDASASRNKLGQTVLHLVVIGKWLQVNILDVFNVCSMQKLTVFF